MLEEAEGDKDDEEGALDAEEGVLIKDERALNDPKGLRYAKEDFEKMIWMDCWIKKKEWHTHEKICQTKQLDRKTKKKTR